MSGRIRISLLVLVAVLLSSILFSTHASATPDVVEPYTYRVATVGGPISLDPAKAYDTTSGAIIFNVYETLIEQDKGAVDEFIPELADSWTISPDGLTYTFHIRTGATFSNGDPVNPDDVEYSFERAMVRDISGGPIWMFNVPLLGIMGTRSWPGVGSTDPVIYQIARITLGQAIESAVTRDDAARTVTFHLLAPEGFFMQNLAQTWGSIVDKEWMTRTYTFPGGAVDTFDWPDNWGPNGYEWWIFNNRAREMQASYFGYKVTPLDNPYQMMGTGPFTFVEFIPGEGGRRTLQRNVNYWGGWPAGAVGTARAGMYPFPSRGYIDNYIEYQISDWESRKLGFLSGAYDSAYVPRAFIAEVWQQPGIRCRYPQESLSASAIFFNFNIANSIPGVTPNFIGTATWGTGLPYTAFSDLNLRKAFVYSVNQTKVLEWYMYEAFQVATPIVPGLAPFTREELISYHIANRFNINLTKAEYYFRLAWGGVDSRFGIPDTPVLPEDPTKVTPGAVWNQGFTFDALAYAGANPTVEAEILFNVATQLTTINPKFHMNVEYASWPHLSGDWLYCPWADYRSIMPLYAIGWLGDFADADNWATPFMQSQGDFAFPQSYYNPTVDTLIEEGRTATDSEVRKAKYTQISDIYIQDLPGIMIPVTLGRRWERTWVQGWYYNPIFPGTNLYTIWKEELPVEDVDANGRVEIMDLSVAAKAYGAYYYQPSLPPHPEGPPSVYSLNWDSRTDINQDMKVDIQDLAMMAMRFGYAQQPWTPP